MLPVTRDSITRAKDERGAVLIIVAAAMFALVFIAAVVIDTANWYEHRRHLQLQADAAALAGAHSFSLGACSDALIAADARKYGGSDSPDGTVVRAQPFNNQVGAPATRVHLLINSSGYYGDAGANDNTDLNGSPCTSKYVDVKVTETNLPWFFGGLVPRINAHARVGLVQQSQSNGSLPIAVPNPLPTSAAAIFIDEASASHPVVASVPLSDVGPSGGLEIWASPAPPSAVSVTIPSRATGVVIALSGRQSISLASNNLATICAQSLTDCYDATADPPSGGVSFIRGWASDPTGAIPAPPQLRSVELFAGSCARGPYFTDSAGCTADIEARIDAGGRNKADMIIKANGSQLFSDAGSVECGQVVGTDPCWHGTVNVPAAAGAVPVAMTWEITAGQVQLNKLEDCKTGGGNKCKGDFEGGQTIQRSYSANDTKSGPIKLVKLFKCDGDASCSLSDFQSYAINSTHTFVVSVGVAGTLRNATSTGDPLVTLRIKSQTGQSLDCDPGYTNLKTELAKGCRPSYIPNTGTPDCSNLGTSALWSTLQPWSCVAVNTGRSPNDVAEGLNTRIFQDNKPPNNACNVLGTYGYNNWANFNPNDPTGNDGFPSGDPRILNAFLTTYGAFSHVNGTSGSVPVIGFGHFYVTGYTGNGGGFDPPGNCNMDAVPNGDSGLIVGHFIRYIDKLGGTGTAPCDPSSINSCVIVMTK